MFKSHPQSSVEFSDEYKKAYTGLLKKSRNIENEVIVIKALKGKKIMEIKPKSRTKKQRKSLARFNYELAKVDKQEVQDVLNTLDLVWSNSLCCRGPTFAQTTSYQIMTACFYAMQLQTQC